MKNCLNILKISRKEKAGLDVCDFDVVLDHDHENHDHDMEYLYGGMSGFLDEVSSRFGVWWKYENRHRQE